MYIFFTPKSNKIATPIWIWRKERI